MWVELKDEDQQRQGLCWIARWFFSADDFKILSCLGLSAERLPHRVSKAKNQMSISSTEMVNPFLLRHVVWIAKTLEHRVLIEQLTANLQITHISSLRDTHQLTVLDSADVLILASPDVDWFTALQMPSVQHLPCIVCLPVEDDALGLDCIQAGAQDYLLPSELTLPNLKRCMQRAQARFHHTTPIAATAEPVPSTVSTVIFQCDAQGRLTFLSATWERFTGLRVSQSVGTQLSVYIYPDDRDIFETTCHELLANPQSVAQKCLVRIFEPTGKCCWCELSLALERDRQGQMVGFLGQIYDITTHYLRQRDLQRSEKLWRGYFDNSLVGLSIISAENTYVQVNQAFCALLGYPLTELIHKYWFELTHPEDLPQELTLYQQLCQGEISTYTLDKRFIRKDGQPVYVRQSVSGVWNDVAELEQTVCTLLDLSDKYAYEAELQASQAFLSHILESLPDPIFVQDEQHCLTVVNSAFSRFYQQPIQTLLGQPVESLLPPVTAALCSARDPLLFQTQKPQVVEEVAIAPDGKLRTLLTKLTVFRSHQNEHHVVGIMQDVTSQRAQEQELRSSKHRLEAAQRVAQLGDWEYDLQTTQVTWSQELFRVLAMPPQEVLTYPEHLAVIHTEDVGHFERCLHAAIATQEQSTLEYRLQRTDGSYAHILGRLQAIADAQGAITKVLGTVLDITERRQARHALQTTQNRLQFLLRTSPAIIFSLLATPPHTITFISANVVLSLGYQSADFLTAPSLWLSCVHPEDRTQLAIDLAALKQQRKLRREYRFRHQGGHYLWMQDELCWVQESDRPTEIVGYLIDISARKEAEDALYQSQERLQLALQGSGLGLWDWNLMTDEVYLSAEWQAMLGYEAKSILGRWQMWEQLIHPDDLEGVWQQLQQHFNGESPYFEVEYRLLDHADDWRWVLARGKVLERESLEQPLRIIGIHQDISDRKDVAQMKDEFISVVSHELRTPLTSIHGSLKLLSTGRLGELNFQGQQMLDIAVRNTQRLSQLINDILDLERLESGKLQANKQWCNTPDLVNQALETLQTTAQERAIKMEVFLSPTLVANHGDRIWADPLQIVQVLTNLLSNAIKFSTPQNSVQVFIRANMKFVLFEVQDYGRGIPTEKLEAIFERFQQVDASDTRRKGGTGLGLTISRQIIEHHGGKIWVKSVVGCGSLFSFTIPHHHQTQSTVSP